MPAAMIGSKPYQMRLPINNEWDTLVDVTHGKNRIMHWEGIYSWCMGVSANRIVRGYFSTRYFSYSYFPVSTRSECIGFRPVFETPASDTMVSDGTAVVAGTLYMNNQPVRVPDNPVWNGDILDYVPGSTLELRDALSNPAYQVRAIKAGKVLIADRVLLQNISWDDIQEALATAKKLAMS